MVNQLFCFVFNMIDSHAAAFDQKTYMQRLLKQAPNSYDFDKMDSPCVLVQDSFLNSPNYEEFLYCYLDYDIVIVEILWWFFFDKILGNPMIAVALTYLVERLLRYIRGKWGEKNISKKTKVDQAFLI
jgi:hypothetical protein